METAGNCGVELQRELTSCQVETATEPVRSRNELAQELRRLRTAAGQAAAHSNARLLAVALPPTVPDAFPITDTPRYRQIAERYAMIAHEQGISGCHVHVEVPGEDAAVAVCTRLRPWLPALLALSSNSAIYRSADSGYASWRSILWGRWPSAGPPPHLESADDYRSMLRQLREIGAMLDDGMVYWDARPSAKFPTVEVRVADVPATVAETVLLATLTRALVITVLGELRSGQVAEPIPDVVLRARYWRAARCGLDDAALPELMAKIAPVLGDLGEHDYATAELARITEVGNGAVRQRRAWRHRGAVEDVLAEAGIATLE